MDSRYPTRRRGRSRHSSRPLVFGPRDDGLHAGGGSEPSAIYAISKQGQRLHRLPRRPGYSGGAGEAIVLWRHAFNVLIDSVRSVDGSSDLGTMDCVREEIVSRPNEL